MRAHRAADVRRLLHAGPRLGIHSDEPDRQPDRRVHAPGLGEGDGRSAHPPAGPRAARALVLFPPHGPARLGGVLERMLPCVRNPWGRPRMLALEPGGCIAWSILPVAI